MGCGCDELEMAYARQDVAVMGHHSVHLERRSSDGSQYVTITNNQVRPLEVFRIVGNSLTYDRPAYISETRYQIINPANQVIFEETSYSTPLTKDGWVDVMAPSIEGFYVARVSTKDNANPLDRSRHDVDLLFEVTRDAPDRPTAPPGGTPLQNFTGITRDLTKLAAVVVGGVLLIQGLGLVKAYSPRR